MSSGVKGLSGGSFCQELHMFGSQSNSVYADVWCVEQCGKVPLMLMLQGPCHLGAALAANAGPQVCLTKVTTKVKAILVVHPYTSIYGSDNSK